MKLQHSLLSLALCATSSIAFAGNTIGVGTDHMFAPSDAHYLYFPYLSVKSSDHSWRFTTDMSYFHDERSKGKIGARFSKDCTDVAAPGANTAGNTGTIGTYGSCFASDASLEGDLWMGDDTSDSPTYSISRKVGGKLEAWQLRVGVEKYFPLVDNILWSVGVSGSINRERVTFNAPNAIASSFVLDNTQTDNNGNTVYAHNATEAYENFYATTQFTDPLGLMSTPREVTRIHLDEVAITIGLAYPVSPSWWLYAKSNLVSYGHGKGSVKGKGQTMLNQMDLAQGGVDSEKRGLVAADASNSGGLWRINGTTQFGMAVYFR